MANRYIFTTTLKGYVNVVRDAGKYNNRHFGYQIPADVLEQVEADRKELLKWVRKKQGLKRPHVNLAPWFVEQNSVDGSGKVKYTYGEGDGSGKSKPEPIWMDRDRNELDQVQREQITAGTKVELVVDQKPYVFGHEGKGFIGTSLKVVSGRCLDIKQVLPAAKVVATVQKQSLIKPMERTLSELVGSAVVFDLQQLLETYLPVVGNEGRNELIQTIRTEAMEYLDQEMI